MHNIYTYIISGRINTALSEQNFQANNARTVIFPAKGRINKNGAAEKATEANVKIIGRTEEDPKIILIAQGNIQSINAPRTISPNSNIVCISPSKRAIRTNNQQTLINTVFQSTLLLFNSVLIIFTLIHR